MTPTPEKREAVARTTEERPTAAEIADMAREASEFRRPAPPPIPVRKRFYLTKCPRCGWIGSSEQCGADSFGDDSDVYCPVCWAAGCEEDPSEAETAGHGEAVYQRITAAGAAHDKLAAEIEGLRRERDELAAMFGDTAARLMLTAVYSLGVDYYRYQLAARASAADTTARKHQETVERLERENAELRAALVWIEQREPATTDMTLAHMMAEAARAALATTDTNRLSAAGASQDGGRDG